MDVSLGLHSALHLRLEASLLKSHQCTPPAIYHPRGVFSSHFFSKKIRFWYIILRYVWLGVGASWVGLDLSLRLFRCNSRWVGLALEGIFAWDVGWTRPPKSGGRSRSRRVQWDPRGDHKRRQFPSHARDGSPGSGLRRVLVELRRHAPLRPPPRARRG